MDFTNTVKMEHHGKIFVRLIALKCSNLEPKIIHNAIHNWIIV